MPFADETFDFTYCQAAFKNFTEPVKAIAEMYRVLKPNGAAVISDLRRDASPDDIKGEINSMRLGPVNKVLTRGMFKQMLLRSAYSLAEMETMIAETPFGKGKINVVGVGFQIWLKK